MQRARTLVLTQSQSNRVHNYRKHSLWCGVSLRETNLVHFLVDRGKFTEVTASKYSADFSSEREMNVTRHTSNQTAAQMAEDLMDVSMKFQSDLVNRFISLVR